MAEPSFTAASSPRARTRRVLFAGGTLVLLAGLVGLLFLFSKPEPGAALEPYRVRSAKLGGDFTLTDHEGRRVSMGDLRGRPALLAFGFTHCPDICPATLAKMSAALNAVDGAAEGARVVFVTVDPERDTPEKLKDYVTYFHEDIIGLTGSLEEITHVAALFSAPFEKIEGDSAVGYLMAHPSFFYVLNPDGKVVYVMPHQTPAPTLAEAITVLMR